MDCVRGDRIVENGSLFHTEKKSKVLFDLIAAALVALASFVAPFASYIYKGNTYTISGFELLSGKTIMGGKVVIDSSTVLWIAIVTALLMALTAVLFQKMKARSGGVSVLMLGIVMAICTAIFSNQVGEILVDTKNPKMGYGALMLMAAGLFSVIRGLQILYKLKVLTALDFMVLPGLLYILVNNYLPMAGIVLAFKKINFAVGIWESEWVGFANFKYLFATKDAFIITRNTILYNITFIIVGNVLGILVGICLSEIFSKKLQKFFQTTILLPQLISMIIVAYIVYGFLSNESGWINNTIFANEETVNFYASKAYWPFILVFVNTWKGLGYSSIIFMSSIISIDRNLYEASYVDGCGRWQQIKHITLPLLKPTIITLVLIQVGRIFYSDFGLFYQVPMDSGTLFSVTQTIDTYVYRSLMKTNNISMASAASAFQSVVGFTIIMIFNGIVRKVNKEDALF
ncbi:ABC transporter permease subunit [Anaerobium acetethylicum]|uniref:ABC-type polysaccharide transport system, permease component n=1 Tax=Anaerobium acetethylicum TaxID=1619234 RepID=A0A1D3TWB2_9FIRM|nr:ABC transporter permease subunit [Anaerobium acetethylicum]SCP98533.1 ABC-type polysaccharide transport system, permease component [Anaerobium acetethylicum]